MRMRMVGGLAALVLLVAAASAPAGLETAGGVMKLVPGDVPLAAVFADMDKLDKTIQQWGRRIDPDAGEGGPLSDLREEIGIGDWVDFSKPLVIAAIEAQGGDPVVWAAVPGFAEKIAAHEGAKNVEGVWEMTLPGGTGRMMYLKALEGDYVVGAASKAELEKAAPKGTTLADELKARAEMLAQRDFVVHVNIGHYRDSALAGIAQAAPMVIMMGGMMAAQGMDAEDAANLQAALTTAMDMVKQFMEQLAYVDVIGSMDAQEANITLATGYVDGPIRAALARTAPADRPMLTGYEEQPYVVASGFHAPGLMASFSDYFFRKMDAAKVAAAPPPPAPAEGEKPAEGEAPKAAPMSDMMRLSMEMGAMTEGGDFVMAFGKDGMRMIGEYLVKDAPKYVGLLKESLKSANAGMGMMGGGGVSFEIIGSSKIGDIDVEQFTMKIEEPADPNMAAMGAPDLSQLYGKNSRYGVGVSKGNVRFCYGTEAEMQKAFTAKVDKPLASGQYVEAALKKLPAKRNGVLLVDIAGAAPLMEMFGQPMSGQLPPGPPFALSFSFCGEPARVDIHIPLRAIERAVQAFSPQQPM